jgi:hypothetical protein
MAPNPFDHFAIQNVIAKYAIALDSKQFHLLSEVFTEDVDTVYPFKGEIKGVKEVADAIKKRSVEHSSQARFKAAYSFAGLLRSRPNMP